MEDKDLSRPWVCEETDSFTPRIRYFDLPKRIRMPSHVKTYDGSEDPEDHLKIFQASAKSIDSYDDLKETFLANYLQQKKCIKDPVEIHHTKQMEGESTEDFVRRFKTKSRDVKGAPEVMRILGFMHGITNPELIKRLHDKIPKSVDELKAIAFDQRVEAKQWKRPSKGGKEGRSRKKGQATSNSDGTDEMKDSQIKDHSNILSGDNDLVPTLRGGRWNGRAYGY
ncbi:reverse transcriptase domain-containing protein [Tanacetum coccineum]|uniref:Reverse transcriptase domain-containing protein n=1 Tax=Tanacetum coccineum TaxID=301880 RepID=A0ABQ4YZY6_9ASTR